MSWRDYLTNDALALEKRLKPEVVQHNDGMKSTANTDVKRNIIHLDVSQQPLKAALSYSYELKNLENAPKYKELNEQARRRLITKSGYVKGVIALEAQAAYFRAKVFRDSALEDDEVPFRKEYLDIFDKAGSQQEAEEALLRYMLDYGLVRRSFTVKKFYADCYDYYAGKKPWPNFYDEQRENTVITLNHEKPQSPDGSFNP
ncbi:hypothetical protein [Legionella spiritensis]|uniref:Uncharacterized protein n=1 Tax=Legionella spiritensis TaxID=452 RepID=A0A0W0YXA3_LEGSP|nr:hypothetical protein [Legionella spiritensis]KTD61541.1 hypothetical protein Lspi_2171 [Legionella spiritensis]SNV32610.1 Uncharacterised protein [Legionella spiritensis]